MGYSNWPITRLLEGLPTASLTWTMTSVRYWPGARRAQRVWVDLMSTGSAPRLVVPFAAADHGHRARNRARSPTRGGLSLRPVGVARTARLALCAFYAVPSTCNSSVHACTFLLMIRSYTTPYTNIPTEVYIFICSLTL